MSVLRRTCLWPKRIQFNALREFLGPLCFLLSLLVKISLEIGSFRLESVVIVDIAWVGVMRPSALYGVLH